MRVAMMNVSPEGMATALAKHYAGDNDLVYRIYHLFMVIFMDYTPCLSMPAKMKFFVMKQFNLWKKQKMQVLTSH